jgi:TPP-dependent trihydroxycyclohexane-1,2-dione (THcHDO) dehydratase
VVGQGRQRWQGKDPGASHCDRPFRSAPQGCKGSEEESSIAADFEDGEFSMLMANFATAVEDKLSIKVVIIKNNTLGKIK